MMAHRHECGFCVVVQAWKVPGLNCALGFADAILFLELDGEIDCLLVALDIVLYSCFCLLPVLIFFIVELLEKVFSKDFHKFHATSVTPTDFLNDTF